jgi:hypothetical protein
MDAKDERQPLVEQAPDEAVVRALSQSAHPVEFIESTGSEDEAEPDN